MRTYSWILVLVLGFPLSAQVPRAGFVGAAGKTPPAAGGGGPLLTDLVSHWSMDETSGTREDSHGSNDLSGTTGSGTGKVGNASDLERGSSHYLTVTDNASLRLGADTAFTIHLWFNSESFNADYSGIIWKGNPAEVNEIEYALVYDNTTDEFFFRVGNGSASGVVFMDFAVGDTGTWHRLCAWHDPDTNLLGIQIDNASEDTAGWSSGTLAQSGTDFYIGNLGGAGYLWDGLVDEVSFWKRVLTSEERLQLWNGGAGIPYSSY